MSDNSLNEHPAIGYLRKLINGEEIELPNWDDSINKYTYDSHVFTKTDRTLRKRMWWADAKNRDGVCNWLSNLGLDTFIHMCEKQGEIEAGIEKRVLCE